MNPRCVRPPNESSRVKSDAREGALPPLFLPVERLPKLTCWLSRRADVGVWFAVGVIAFVTLQSLGLTPIRGHDTFAHYFRLAEVDALWRSGIWLSRWSPNLMFGYGYPLFNFYSPLSTFVLACFYRAMGENALVAQAVMYGTLLATAAVAMFLLARRLYGAPGAVFAAAAYAWSPHLLYQTFERGSLSNAMAMALAPLAALSLVHAAWSANSRRVALSSLAVGAFLLTHLTAGVIMFPGLVLIGGLAVMDADKPRRGLWAVSSALGAGVVLAACVWLPAVVEIQQTQYRRLMSGIDYRQHFASLWSWPGTVVAGVMNPPLPITVGATQLTLGIVAVVVGSVRLWRGRRAPGARTTAEYLAPLGGALGLALAALASLPSAPIWARLTVLRDLQFPWRCLDGTCLLLALSSGWLIDTAFRRSWWRQLLSCIGLVTIFANALPYLYPPRTHVLPARPTLADASAAQRRYDIDGLTSVGEYRPSRVNWRPRVPPFPGADQNASLAQKLRRDTRVGLTVRDLASGPLHADLAMDAATPVRLVFETFYFPGWEATIDGRRHPVRADPSGLLAVDVPEGIHRAHVAFARTKIRAVADTLSSVTAIACVIGLVLGSRGQMAARSRPLVAAISHRGQLPILVLLIALTGTKLAWFDAYDSPLVKHVRSGSLADSRRPPWKDFGGELMLLGYTYEPARGLTLYWLAQRTLSRPYVIDLTFTGLDGRILGQVHQANPGVNWTAYWEAGLLVRDVHRAPEHGSPGSATLSVRDRDTGTPLLLRDSPDGWATATALSFDSRPIQ